MTSMVNKADTALKALFPVHTSPETLPVSFRYGKDLKTAWK